MVPEVYFYVPKEQVEAVVECGLKLSAWCDRRVWIDGENRPCISALLNPRDDADKYNSKAFGCLKLELPAKHCWVADRRLFEIGRTCPAAMELYRKSVIPLERYYFGTYRLPECLVTTTVLPHQISVLNKIMDSPVLFESSEQLYVNNIVEDLKEKRDYLLDALLYCYFEKLAESKKVVGLKDAESGMAAFLDSRDGRTVIVKMPDFTAY